MQNKSCLSEIKARYNRLTKKEKQLADYILANYEDILLMSTTQLAQNSGVVKSVIVRLCRDLGFSGYIEFKLCLSKESAKNEQFNFTPYISPDDSSSEIFDKVFAANIKTLHDTILSLDKTVIKSSVDALERAESIYIYGVGTSSGIAIDFQFRLMQLGFKAFCFTDVANMKVSTLNIKKGDVAIGISNSGRTIATVDALFCAKERGAVTICVTSYPDSKITECSDLPIVIKTDEIHYPTEAISARIAHISVLDSLAVALSARHYSDTMERSAKTRDLIDTVRYQE